MTLNRKHKIFIGAAAVVAAAGGGVAVAASQDTSPGAESKAVIDDAAKQLGIPSAKLSDALKTALADRVDAAVAAGRITKAQGDAMKQRIQSGDFPVLGGFHGGGFGHHGGRLDGAAAYIGITDAQLRTELESGKTLAQVAKAHGKTADGLIAAMVAAEKKELDAAVTSGRITKAQEDQMVSNLKARITNLVNRTGPPQGPPGFRGGHEGFRHFDDGPSA